MGLSWGDVNFVNGTVRVNHSFDRFRNLKQPKTTAGTRILPLPPFTADALHKRQAFQLAGHNDPSITLGSYTHVNMQQQREAMNAMQCVFN